PHQAPTQPAASARKGEGEGGSQGPTGGAAGLGGRLIMARKAARQDHVNHERWLVSYADFITLLFAFFVVMFATSQTDKARAQQVSDSVNSAIEKGGVTAAVHEILGGTVDDRGKGNAQMRGAGGSETSQVERLVPAELIPS